MTAKRFIYDGLHIRDLHGKIPPILANNDKIRDKYLKELNELHEEKEQLLSDKEHLMGCLIRFFGYDDEDIDYNLNRESNREYGKYYYDMKEEDW